MSPGCQCRVHLTFDHKLLGKLKALFTLSARRSWGLALLKMLFMIFWWLPPAFHAVTKKGFYKGVVSGSVHFSFLSQIESLSNGGCWDTPDDIVGVILTLPPSVRLQLALSSAMFMPSGWWALLPEKNQGHSYYRSSWMTMLAFLPLSMCICFLTNSWDRVIRKHVLIIPNANACPTLQHLVANHLEALQP